ncbi:MAG: glycogen synthase [Candidatus Kapabacteria bacterium]|nr:glycogen synthase [Candidatus Kapabacteria bacterium]
MPKDWEKDDHKTIIILPKYRDIDTSKFNIIPTDIIISVPISTWREYARLWIGTLPNSTVPVYFLESRDYFDRKGIYGNPEGFADNDRRFVFLSRAVFEVCKALNFRPDIIHSHDYHTGFAMAFLKTHYRYDPLFARCAGVYTIHNMAYQGQSDPRRVMEYAGFGTQNFRGSWFEHDSVVNMMKTALMFSDKITTVSPTYAYEIRWTNNGEGMQDYLNSRGGDVIGILNGIDETEWNPEIDTHLIKQYSPEMLEEKAENKLKLLREAIPTYDLKNDLPVIGMVSRLTDQKGIALLEKSMEQLLTSGRVRFLILGSGEKRYEDFFRYMGKKYPTRALVMTGYNNALSHQVIAASDYLIVPSLFEPCGLTQMYALKYGTIPIVRATGGLADTVQEYDPQQGTGTGFTFTQYSSKSLVNAVSRAVYYYKAQPHWDTLRVNAMAQQNESKRSADMYINVFRWALEKRGISIPT